MLVWHWSKYLGMGRKVPSCVSKVEFVSLSAVLAGELPMEHTFLLSQKTRTCWKRRFLVSYSFQWLLITWADFYQSCLFLTPSPVFVGSLGLWLQGIPCVWNALGWGSLDCSLVFTGGPNVWGFCSVRDAWATVFETLACGQEGCVTLRLLSMYEGCQVLCCRAGSWMRLLVSMEFRAPVVQ